jgi:glycerol uptake facilitator-like aquaporin
LRTTLARRCAAEAGGTAFLVATVIGSGLMAARLTDDVALRLLVNALATGAMLAVLIALLAPISGAQFNPVVSLVGALRGTLSRRELAAYVAAQTAGGVAGTLLAHAMFGRPLLQLGTTLRTGPDQWLAETVATFGLVAIVLLARRPHALPLLIGGYIGAAYFFTASTSFANPAVTVARLLTDSFAGIRPLDAPGFILAQLAGALLALVACRWLVPARAAD